MIVIQRKGRNNNWPYSYDLIDLLNNVRCTIGIQMGIYTISATMGEALYCKCDLYNVYILSVFINF